MSQLALLLSNQSSSRVQSPTHSSICSPPVSPPVLLLYSKPLCSFSSPQFISRTQNANWDTNLKQCILMWINMSSRPTRINKEVLGSCESIVIVNLALWLHANPNAVTCNYRRPHSCYNVWQMQESRCYSAHYHLFIHQCLNTIGHVTPWLSNQTVRCMFNDPTTSDLSLIK